MDQEDARIADAALRKGFISFERLRETVDRLGTNGTPKPLGETLLAEGLISRIQFEEIRRAADSPVEPPAEASDDARFCESIVRRGLLTFAQVYEALRLREKYRKGGRYLKSVDDVLIEHGMLTERQARQSRGANATPRIVLPEQTHSKIGEQALLRGYITEEQLGDCLRAQAAQKRSGAKSRRLGEILLSKGYIDPEQLDELLTAHAQESSDLKIPGYQILEKIGAGGMGEIYKARQISVDRIAAIKVLHPRFSKDQEYMNRFVREARLLARLDHPYIVKAIDAGHARGTYYYVMEFVDGSTVFKLLNEKGRLAERDCLKIGLYVAHALEHAAKHKMVHRDIKPTNIMITRDGVVKLCDLGIAKLLDATGAASEHDWTRQGYAVGSPYYISPESCLGQDVDIRSDIYSLGATLYHCVTGRPAFNGATAAAVLAQHVHKEPEPPGEIVPGISKELSGAILKMLAKLPEERFGSPTDLARVLDELMRRKPGVAQPSPIEPQVAHSGNSASTPIDVPAPEIRTTQIKPQVVYRVSWKAVLAAVTGTLLACGALTAYLLSRAGALDLPFLK